MHESSLSSPSLEASSGKMSSYVTFRLERFTDFLFMNRSHEPDKNAAFFPFWKRFVLVCYAASRNRKKRFVVTVHKEETGRRKEPLREYVQGFQLQDYCFKHMTESWNLWTVISVSLTNQLLISFSSWFERFFVKRLTAKEKEFGNCQPLNR